MTKMTKMTMIRKQDHVQNQALNREVHQALSQEVHQAPSHHQMKTRMILVQMTTRMILTQITMKKHLTMTMKKHLMMMKTRNKNLKQESGLFN